MTRRRIDLTRTKLRGVPEELRHAYVDVDNLGILCRKCGQQQPRMDQREEPCRRPAMEVEAALRQRRERALPALMLGHAFARLFKEQGTTFDPGVVKALTAACKQPFVGLPMALFNPELRRAVQDAKLAYQGAGAEVGPHTHCLGVAMLVVQLVDRGLLDEPQNQGVLTSLRLLDEAEEHPGDWNHVPGTLQPVADQMLKAAQLLGYYGARATTSALGPGAMH